MPKVDYRHDPWTDTNQPSAITGEKHIIPTSSPYIIRLKERPLKEAPSSITVKLCDILTVAITSTSATTITVGNGAWWAQNDIILIDNEKMQLTAAPSGNNLTVSRGYGGTTAATHSLGADVLLDTKFEEVAAAPAARQYWPDYNAEVADDSSWNNGDLQFNSAQAGMLVTIDYKGMGTNADRYLELTEQTSTTFCTSNGSEGDYISTGNFNLSGIHDYRNFVLNAGHTMTANGNLTVIRCTGTAIIDGTITSQGYGGTAGTGVYHASGTNGGVGYGGGGGGNGGPTGYTSPGGGGSSYLCGIVAANPSATPSASFQGQIAVSLYGSGHLSGGGGGGGAGSDTVTGGNGGNGGGGIVIIAKNIKFTGTINAKGADGAYGAGGGGGGGGGGTIVLAAKNWWADTGTLYVTGGYGGGSQYFSGGANGGAGWYKKLTL